MVIRSSWRVCCQLNNDSAKNIGVSSYANNNAIYTKRDMCSIIVLAWKYTHHEVIDYTGNVANWSVKRVIMNG